MKLQSRINLFALTILILLTLALVLIGTLVINDIVYGLNQRLLTLEIENQVREIEEGYAVLERTGVAAVPSFVSRMKAERIETVQKATFGKTGRLAIFTEDGKVVFHPTLEAGRTVVAPYIRRMAARKTGAMAFREEGERRYGVFRTFRPWRWLVVLSVTESEMFEKRTVYLSQVSLLALVMLGVALLLSTLLTRRIVRRIRAALECADRVREGDLTARIDPIPVDDEIGGLQENINAMVARIEERTLENRKTRRELKESKEKYQGYIENAPDMVFVFDGEGRFLEVNAAAVSAAGYTREELTAMGLADLFLYECSEAGPVAVDRSWDAAQPAAEVRIQRKDGSLFYGLVEAVRLSENRYLGFCKDITQRKSLETQLQQAHKMEALGTLSGGVAHDINNILGIILGNAELAMETVSADNPASENLEEIYRACLRGKDVVRRILSYSRKTKRKAAPLRLTPILEEALKRLRSSAPASVSIRKKISTAADGVMADAAGLQQIVMNLSTNAVQAMGEKGGVLTISLETVSFPESDTAADGRPGPGDWLKLSVADTGAGIEAGLIERIFDPYFTTKGLAEASGMGLSIVHGLVRDYGGTVAVRSAPGQETVFDVFLPVETIPDAPVADTPDPIPRGCERILFVDDEGAVVDFGREMLARLGYRAETARSPLDALDRFRQDPYRFDLVITDMTMPDMQGSALITELRAIRDDIPIILSTGYSDIMTDIDARELAIQGILIKPYMSREIATLIRRALDGAEGPPLKDARRASR